ncbi:hypothetical protein ONZ51_g12699 [Trametes cubensis]|uniref:DUF6533 domain-containing protein n=1 Tax=Trametes cubensis TaxID=1111947 RepID=A0AAD7THT7_9APHY|nr:hypothetical protein ONZ51_g12699 [Trametes cubensis]
MSSQGPEFVDIVRLTLLGNRLELAMICVLCYDYVITFGQEVRCIWMRKKTGATVLYLFIRYVCLVSYCILPAVTYILTLNVERSGFCTLIGRMQVITELIAFIPLGAFSAMRALALSGMNCKLAALVFILACGPFAVNIWLYSENGVHAVTLPVIGCTDVSNETAYEARIGEATYMAPFIGTVLNNRLHYQAGIGMTWRSGGMPGGRPSLVKAMVLHGTLYFVTLLILNVLHLTFTLMSELIAAEQTASLVQLFTDPLTIIITCRFLLALQSANMELTGENTGAECDTLRFASLVIGSLGGVVDAGIDGGAAEEDCLSTPAEVSEGDTPSVGADTGRCCERGLL